MGEDPASSEVSRILRSANEGESVEMGALLPLVANGRSHRQFQVTAGSIKILDETGIRLPNKREQLFEFFLLLR